MKISFSDIAPSAPNRLSLDQSQEHEIERRGSTYSIYSRMSPSNDSVVVFVPGGGHNGRIAYGHSQADKECFLDHWLQRQNIGLIALSHAEMADQNNGEMSLQTMADDWAGIVQDFVQHTSRSIVVVGWSAAGRIVNRLFAAMARLGLTPSCFISLAATPPFLGLVQSGYECEAQSPPGVWRPGETPLSCGTLRKQSWHRELHEHMVGQDCEPLSTSDYFDNYLQSSPISLRGEPPSASSGDSGNAISAMSTFAWHNYPVCGCIVPDSPSDARHALSDAALWGCISVQAITARMLRSCSAKTIPQPRWNELIQIVDELPTRLRRRVSGGHFFFVGRAAALRTAEYIQDIAQQVNYLSNRFPELTLQEPTDEKPSHEF